MKSSMSFVISRVIFGLIFIALSVFLFILGGESTLVKIISGADALFGLLLILRGIIPALGAKKKNAPADEGNYYAAPVESDNVPDEPVVDYSTAVDTIAAEPEYTPADFDSMSLEEITAEEQRLRVAARDAAQRAREAAEQARIAFAQADEANAAVDQAEHEIYQLAGVERQNAIRNIQRLTDNATVLNTEAMAARENAIRLRTEADNLAAEHSRAVDAAAGKMDDDF